MAAGMATLMILKNREVYTKLEEKSKRLFSGIEEAAEHAGVDIVSNRVGSIGSIFFTSNPVVDFDAVRKTDSSRYPSFYREMLAQKIYLAPSPFEAMFISLAHNEEALKKTVDAASISFKKLS